MDLAPCPQTPNPFLQVLPPPSLPKALSVPTYLHPLPHAHPLYRMRWRYPHKGPQFMSPGEVYKIEIDLWSTSYIFMPNHRSVSTSRGPS